uniref:Uncharacterized protein n=1 Tax=Trichuris muris TaxID=70415 RepID=A0A5S6R1D9_TRIMR
MKVGKRGQKNLGRKSLQFDSPNDGAEPVLEEVGRTMNAESDAARKMSDGKRDADKRPKLSSPVQAPLEGQKDLERKSLQFDSPTDGAEPVLEEVGRTMNAESDAARKMSDGKRDADQRLKLSSPVQAPLEVNVNGTTDFKSNSNEDGQAWSEGPRTDEFAIRQSDRRC